LTEIMVRADPRLRAIDRARALPLPAVAAVGYDRSGKSSSQHGQLDLEMSGYASAAQNHSFAESEIAAPRWNAATPVLTDPDGRFDRHYNRRHFMFAHGLSGNPVFEPASLLALAKRMPDHTDTYWSNGDVGVSDGWKKGTAGRRSLEETIAGIATNDSIVILKHTEQDPVVGPVLRAFLGKVVEFAGPRMRDDVLVGEALIFISSPNRTTPFHIDGETNFIVQVAGDKTVCVFDHTDRRLVTEAEIEGYHNGNHSSAVYRPDLQKEATVYDLRAGTGIHVPPTAPHWVKNGDNVSVTLSITYELRSLERQGIVYRMNSRLRRLGLNPFPPGRSSRRDGVKAVLGGAYEAIRAVAHPPRPGHRYPKWTPQG
jgi:hypothetical protein